MSVCAAVGHVTASQVHRGGNATWPRHTDWGVDARQFYNVNIAKGVDRCHTTLDLCVTLCLRLRSVNLHTHFWAYPW